MDFSVAALWQMNSITCCADGVFGAGGNKSGMSQMVHFVVVCVFLSVTQNPNLIAGGMTLGLMYLILIGTVFRHSTRLQVSNESNEMSSSSSLLLLLRLFFFSYFDTFPNDNTIFELINCAKFRIGIDVYLIRPIHRQVFQLQQQQHNENTKIGRETEKKNENSV